MRHIASILLLCLGTPLLAQELGCLENQRHPSTLFTDAQKEAIQRGAAGKDPVVEEYLKKYGPPKELPKDVPAPDPKKAATISWEQARMLLLLGLIRATDQTHTLTVLLLSSSGRTYRTIEPRLDEVYRVSRIVDPCRFYILHVTE